MIDNSRSEFKLVILVSLFPVFRFVPQLCGIALVVIGGVSLAKIADLQDISDEHSIVAPSILFIVLGSIVFVIAFFGCCGAIRESYCMTTTVSGVVVEQQSGTLYS